MGCDLKINYKRKLVIVLAIFVFLIWFLYYQNNRIPFLGGIIAPNQGFLPEYTAGKYNEKNSTMIVNRGLGNSIIPQRVFNRPEIVVVTLSSVN